MKEPKPLGARVLWALLETGLLLFGEFLVLPVFIGYFFIALWLFDRFHVSDLDTQLAFVLAPFVLGGLWIVIHLRRKSWKGD